MPLCTIAKIKSIGLAQQIVTGAFINGALIGVGLAVAISSAKKASDERNKQSSPTPN